MMVVAVVVVLVVAIKVMVALVVVVAVAEAVVVAEAAVVAEMLADIKLEYAKLQKGSPHNDYLHLFIFNATYCFLQ